MYCSDGVVWFVFRFITSNDFTSFVLLWRCGMICFPLYYFKWFYEFCTALTVWYDLFSALLLQMILRVLYCSGDVVWFVFRFITSNDFTSFVLLWRCGMICFPLYYFKWFYEFCTALTVWYDLFSALLLQMILRVFVLLWRCGMICFPLYYFKWFYEFCTALAMWYDLFSALLLQMILRVFVLLWRCGMICFPLYYFKWFYEFCTALTVWYDLFSALLLQMILWVLYCSDGVVWFVFRFITSNDFTSVVLLWRCGIICFPLYYFKWFYEFCTALAMWYDLFSALLLQMILRVLYCSDGVVWFVFRFITSNDFTSFCTALAMWYDLFSALLLQMILRVLYCSDGVVWFVFRFITSNDFMSFVLLWRCGMICFPLYYFKWFYEFCTALAMWYNLFSALLLQMILRVLYCSGDVVWFVFRFITSNDFTSFVLLWRCGMICFPLYYFKWFYEFLYCSGDVVWFVFRFITSNDFTSFVLLWRCGMICFPLYYSKWFYEFLYCSGDVVWFVFRFITSNDFTSFVLLWWCGMYGLFSALLLQMILRVLYCSDGVVWFVFRFITSNDFTSFCTALAMWYDLFSALLLQMILRVFVLLWRCGMICFPLYYFKWFYTSFVLLWRYGMICFPLYYFKWFYEFLYCSGDVVWFVFRFITSNDFTSFCTALAMWYDLFSALLLQMILRVLYCSGDVVWFIFRFITSNDFTSFVLLWRCGMICFPLYYFKWFYEFLYCSGDVVWFVFRFITSNDFTSFVLLWRCGMICFPLYYFKWFYTSFVLLWRYGMICFPLYYFKWFYEFLYCSGDVVWFVFRFITSNDFTSFCTALAMWYDLFSALLLQMILRVLYCSDGVVWFVFRFITSNDFTSFVLLWRCGMICFPLYYFKWFYEFCTALTVWYDLFSALLLQMILRVLYCSGDVVWFVFRFITSNDFTSFVLLWRCGMICFPLYYFKWFYEFCTALTVWYDLFSALLLQMILRVFVLLWRCGMICFPLYYFKWFYEFCTALAMWYDLFSTLLLQMILRVLYCSGDVVWFAFRFITSNDFTSFVLFWRCGMICFPLYYFKWFYELLTALGTERLSLDCLL